MKRALGLALAAALCALAAGCFENRPASVALGVALTLSDHDAIRMAAEEINAAGGIQGLPLRLVGMERRFADDTDARARIASADRLAADPEVLAVVGHSDSASSLAAAALYNQRRLPQLVTIATHAEITAVGAWTYRLCITDDSQGRVLAAYAVHDWGKRRIAVFHVNDDYGRGLTEVFERTVALLGARIVAATPLSGAPEPDDLDLVRQVVRRLEGTVRPDLYVLLQRAEGALRVTEIVRAVAPRADILGSDNVALFTVAGNRPDLTDGIRSVTFYLPSGENPRAAAFAREFERRARRRPNYSDALAYDAVYLFRDAVSHGGRARSAVKGFLDRMIRESTTISGVAGSYAFAPDRNALRDVYIADHRGNEAVLLKVIPGGS